MGIMETSTKLTPLEATLKYIASLEKKVADATKLAEIYREIKERAERKLASASIAKAILIKNQQGLDEKSAQYQDYQENIERLDKNIKPAGAKLPSWPFF